MQKFVELKEQLKHHLLKLKECDLFILDIEEILENAPKDEIIINNLIKAYEKITSPLYNVILCSVSGGSDSDIIIDICSKMDTEKKIKYIWFDTGLEYEATKQHLAYLEHKYGIEIEKFKAKKAIPICCKEYGQPFLSKQVSEFMSRLQRHNFQWEDDTYDILVSRYPNCKSALEWWCNTKGGTSMFNIDNNKYLKEFIIENPPWFFISNKCCEWAKKKVAKQCKKEIGCDLNIIGVRKFEGGMRSTAYKNCFTSKVNESDEYRPIFFYTNKTKDLYDKFYGIVHSECYTQYGLKRTGCAGCPYGRNFEEELQIIKAYEPKLYKAVNTIFVDSYKYTRMYREFVKQKKKNDLSCKYISGR